MFGENLNKFIFFIVMLALGGCTHDEKSACKVVNGAKCKSVTEVNELVTNGELKSDSEFSNVSKNKHSTIPAYLPSTINVEQGSQNIVRIPEKTARIWIRGFNDSMGDYVEETYIYTILENGRWENVG